MPRALVTRDGSTFHMKEYDLPDPGPGDVRVRVQFAAPKHGTEKKGMSDSPFSRKRWDPELRMFLPPEPAPDAPPPLMERGIGNMVVGVVDCVGDDVQQVAPGDRVFGYGQVQEVVQAPESHWYPLGSLAPEDAVCVDPAHVAFVAVRDGNVRIADTVAVFGLGAIGLMAVQIARAAGAQQVFAVDPIPLRRECAQAHGADRALDPTACDAALEIKLATDRCGVDVAIETSGNGRALHEAIRCLRQCGTVVHAPWGPRDCSDLHLDEEFHLNRPTIIGSQTWQGWGNPDRAHPLWSPQRAFDAVIQLFRDGKLTGRGVVTPIVPFEEAADALAGVFDRPAESIKAGVTFS